MAENTNKPNRRAWYWFSGILLTTIILSFGIWLKLPMIAGHFLKYEWSRDYSLNVLEYLGPRAAGVLFEYHDDCR